MANIRVWKLTSGDPRQPVFNGKIEAEGDFTRAEWEHIQAMFMGMKRNRPAPRIPQPQPKRIEHIRILMLEDRNPQI